MTFFQKKVRETLRRVGRRLLKEGSSRMEVFFFFFLFCFLFFLFILFVRRNARLV